ncbi:extensin-like domain-containing protein [Kozakia baliensis]|uniref:extensin-like domain-containing protein n=1 Tax=Kozakia baliensis TaxID=153496 RepID=UPI000498183A|nr:extensin family protein [Kozakia baliensis]
MGRVLLLLLLFLAMALAFHRAWLPPEWDPIQPLNLKAPRTPMTRLKLAWLQHDSQRCLAALQTSPLQWRVAQGLRAGQCPLPDAVRILGGPVATSPSSFLASCRLAVDWSLFVTDAAQPEALSAYGKSLRTIEHVGSYNCRDVRERPGALSSHARADAIDVSGFVLADGRRVLVSAWNDKGRDGVFLHAIRQSACRFFGIVLSPDYNALHAEHLHLEASNWALCR